MGTYADMERSYYRREPAGEPCEWHPDEEAKGCPECVAEAEAAQPDTVKEAEGWA